MKLRKEVEELAIEVCKRHSHGYIDQLHVFRALQSKVGTAGSDVTTRMIDKELDKIPVVRNAVLSMSEGATNLLNMLETTDPIEARDKFSDWYFSPPAPEDGDNQDPDAPRNDLPNKPAEPKKTPPKAKTPVKGKNESLDDVLAELNALIGLEKAKSQVNALIALHKANSVRKQQNLPPVPVGLHLVFRGSPGTGKTTVARLIGRLYKAIGLLQGGQLIEVDRSQLVAGYVGQTAIRTQEAIDAADGGVLFIDEAYSLISDTGSNHGFGDEAIATLVKAMEDKRDSMAVVVAGYTEDMDMFIKANQGLKSRFQTYVDFEDYNTEDLIKIFKSISAESKVACPLDVEDALRQYINAFQPQGSDGNGRFARNLFEKMFMNLTTRAMADGTIEPHELESFKPEDVPAIPNAPEENPNKPKFGFA
ncbi:COG1223 Predicted ATPase (AAA+ superfamily) [Candidatus Nanopelagicaceae bacterium]